MSENPLHIREARIDDDGRVIAIGKVTYSGDGKGYFFLNKHSEIAFEVHPLANQEAYITLSPTNTVRNNNSGFLDADDIGPIIYLPTALTSVLFKALSFKCEEPIKIAFGEISGGDLRSNGNRPNSKQLLLTDWNLELYEDGNEIVVRLSALLSNTHSSKEGKKIWFLDNKVPSRIQIDCTVDLITRAVKWGTYNKQFATGQNALNYQSDLSISTLSSYKLGNALISFGNHIYGIFSDNRLGGVYTGRGFAPMLTFSRFDKFRRYNNGFIENPFGTSEVMPRVSISGINMGVIMGLLKINRTALLEVNNGDFGTYSNPGRERSDYESGEPPRSSKIKSVLLSLTLDIDGLKINYKTFSDNPIRGETAGGWMLGEFLLSWEVIIIKFPELLHHRDAILKETLHAN